MLSGAAMLLAPWERMSPRWLHAIIAGGLIEVALGVLIFSDDYAFDFVIVGIYAAYVLRSQRAEIAYAVAFLILGIVSLGLDSNDFDSRLHHMLVLIPVLTIAAGMVRYLRDTLERSQAEYRGFAAEAVHLAVRIRGTTRPQDGDAVDRRLEELEAHAAEPIAGASDDPPVSSGQSRD